MRLNNNLKWAPNNILCLSEIEPLFRLFLSNELKSASDFLFSKMYLVKATCLCILYLFFGFSFVPEKTLFIGIAKLIVASYAAVVVVILKLLKYQV